SLIATGPLSANPTADTDFNNARNNITSTQIPAPGNVTAVAVYVFVRVMNLGPAPVRGIKITAVTCACATGWVYPDNWDHLVDSIHVPAVDDSPSTSYFSGPLAVGDGYIARLVIPVGSNYSGFSGPPHACCLTRVTAANDIGFSRVTYSGGGAQPQFNNIMQRNLNIVP